MEDIVTENAQEVECVENEKKFVPFFKCSSDQITFEFLYLLIFVIISGITLFLVQIGSFTFINYSTKVYLFSVIGGALGGWAYSAKWFYRVVGRGKNGQYPWSWEPIKFYWRILVPILSGVSSLALFTMAVSNIISFIRIEKFNGSSAFGFSFLVGYFSDVIFSKLATYIEDSFEKNKPKG